MQFYDIRKNCRKEKRKEICLFWKSKKEDYMTISQNYPLSRCNEKSLYYIKEARMQFYGCRKKHRKKEKCLLCKFNRKDSTTTSRNYVFEI